MQLDHGGLDRYAYFLVSALQHTAVELEFNVVRACPIQATVTSVPGVSGETSWRGAPLGEAWGRLVIWLFPARSLAEDGACAQCQVHWNVFD